MLVMAVPGIGLDVTSGIFWSCPCRRATVAEAAEGVYINTPLFGTGRSG